MDTLRRFSVYYLGSQPVMSSSNTDEVMDVVQVCIGGGRRWNMGKRDALGCNVTTAEPYHCVSNVHSADADVCWSLRWHGAAGGVLFQPHSL